MKVFIALLACVAVASAGFVIRGAEDLTLARAGCIKELGIGEETVAEFKKKNFGPADACYIRCAFTRLEFYSDDTGFLVENFLTQLRGDREDDVRAAVEKCLDFEETDKCMRAFRGFVCFAKNGLLPKGI